MTVYTHFEGGGRQVVVAAQAQARRLGHAFIGCEHLLYGLACDDGRVGALLRQAGATPERCEAEFVRLIGARSRARSAAAAGTDPLDGAALGSLGIDLDAVRNRVEAVFGPGALTAAAVRPQRSRRPAWPRRRRPAGSDPGPRRRARSRSGTHVQAAPGPWSPVHPAPGHLPLTRRAEACLKRSLAHARSARTGILGAEDVALELLAMDCDIPRRVLSALGVSAARLRAEILRTDGPIS